MGGNLANWPMLTIIITSAEDAFRALTFGYTHWASGRLEQMEINLDFCHVRCNMKGIHEE